MIRNVQPADTEAILAIYNDYVENSVVTFETEPVTRTQMDARISEISAGFPYLVYEQDGVVVGYCYAHPWKERAAYRYTLETTVYLASSCRGKGIGRQLMVSLIASCRKAGYHALIACITGGNEASNRLHLSLGFKQVSCFEQVGLKFGRRLDVLDFELLLAE